jgi:hypothetical protein
MPAAALFTQAGQTVAPRHQRLAIGRFYNRSVLTLAQGGAIVDHFAITLNRRAVHEFHPATLATSLHGSRELGQPRAASDHRSLPIVSHRTPIIVYLSIVLPAVYTQPQVVLLA